MSKLIGRVDMGDAEWDGELSEADEGKRRRSEPNKVLFVVTVAISHGGRPLRLMLYVAERHLSAEIEKMAKAWVAKSACVVSDGLACFRAVTKAGRGHQPVTAAEHD